MRGVPVVLSTEQRGSMSDGVRPYRHRRRASGSSDHSRAACRLLALPVCPRWLRLLCAPAPTGSLFSGGFRSVSPVPTSACLSSTALAVDTMMMPDRYPAVKRPMSDRAPTAVLRVFSVTYIVRMRSGACARAKKRTRRSQERMRSAQLDSGLSLWLAAISGERQSLLRCRSRRRIASIADE
jgi:hypothetical protein